MKPSPCRLFLLFSASFVLTAFLHGFEAFFAAFGTLGSAFDKLSAHQLELGDFGAIAAAPAQTHDAGIAAVALAKLGAELVE